MSQIFPTITASCIVQQVCCKHCDQWENCIKETLTSERKAKISALGIFIQLDYGSKCERKYLRYIVYFLSRGLLFCFFPTCSLHDCSGKSFWSNQVLLLVPDRNPFREQANRGALVLMLQSRQILRPRMPLNIVFLKPQ